MKKVTILLVFAVILCSCTQQPVETIPTTEPRVTQMPTLPPTEAPTKAPTEPDLSIEISAGTHQDIFTDEQTGDYLDYYLYVPENAVKEMPLIVFLHGDGLVGNMEALESYGMIEKAREIYGEEFPFIALSPCTRVKSWINGNIPTTLKGLIDAIVAQCEIDPAHIIITGHSRGSIGTWYMISTYGDYFSAAVPVSCGNEKALNMENCIKVPIWGFAGNSGQDEAMYRDAMASAIRRITDAGGQGELTLLEGMNHGQTASEAYTAETFAWMLEQ